MTQFRAFYIKKCFQGLAFFQYLRMEVFLVQIYFEMTSYY